MRKEGETVDAEEIAVLAAGLGKALADGLAANETAKEEKSRAEKQTDADTAEAKRVAQKKSKALHEVLERCAGEKRIIASRVEAAVSQYCSEARGDVLEPLKKDSRMPRTINYLERYSALVGVQDRQAVLKRLLATIDLADEILEGADDVDVEAAMQEAAAVYASRVSGLNGILVSAPDPVLDAEKSSDEDCAGLNDIIEADDVSSAIELAFSSAFGEISELEMLLADEVEAKKAQEDALNKQIEEAVKAASKAARSAYRRNAAALSGLVYEIGCPEPFEGGIIVKTKGNLDQIKELSTEVRKSFKTFAQVVQDNGLFAAFASENAYGACKGFHFDWWWDDLFYDEYEGEIPGRQTYEDIPTAVEEDKGGDSIEKSIERMRSFNKKKYWGMLDDDFQDHVEAFWYGFKKLMVNVNGLFEVDTRAFGNYCNKVSGAARSKARMLGMRMDAYQAEQFREEIAKRSRG